MNQKGFTLLELLLSILILTIILVSFMTFFSQSSLFIKKNDEKFNAANTAQYVINMLQEKEKDKKDKKEFIILPESIKNKINNGQIGIITNNTEEFRSIFDQELESNFKITLQFKKRVEINSLIEVKLFVSNIENKRDEAVTYTYIRGAGK